MLTKVKIYIIFYFKRLRSSCDVCNYRKPQTVVLSLINSVANCYSSKKFSSYFTCPQILMQFHFIFFKWVRNNYNSNSLSYIYTTWVMPIITKEGQSNRTCFATIRRFQLIYIILLTGISLSGPIITFAGLTATFYLFSPYDGPQFHRCYYTLFSYNIFSSRIKTYDQNTILISSS